MNKKEERERPSSHFLGNHSKEFGNQRNLSSHIPFGHALYLSLTCSSFRILGVFATRSRTRKSPCQVWLTVGERLDEAIVLFNQVVAVFDLPQCHVFGQDSSSFQVGNGFGISRVFIDVDHTRSQVYGS
jgi:hypothetical protein